MFTRYVSCLWVTHTLVLLSLMFYQPIEVADLMTFKVYLSQIIPLFLFQINGSMCTGKHQINFSIRISISGIQRIPIKRDTDAFYKNAKIFVEENALLSFPINIVTTVIVKRR